jgi:hypothetical protein
LGINEALVVFARYEHAAKNRTRIVLEKFKLNTVHISKHLNIGRLLDSFYVIGSKMSLQV